ncbi:MAG: glycosyltransferase family 39 protein [Candidatus Sabulitectum sp.]|nr:glycosyltransferase family 39 protein [Candidatus Sabulitectum sp.]
MRIGDRTDLLFYGLVLLVVSLMYLLFYAEIPIYGDAWGYGYSSANWIAENGLPFVPTGTGKGNTACGHFTVYFWLWAVLMRVAGDSVRVAHLLPAVFSFLAVAGTYRLSRDIGGKTMGVFAGIALLVSPLFLAQAFRPLPIAAVMAASIWSLFFYRREKYLTATLLCAFAVMMREQALMLAVTYITAELFLFRQLSWRRILLFAIPFLILAIHGTLSFFVNRVNFHFYSALSLKEPFSISLLLYGVRHFGGFYLTDCFRWLPVAAGMGLLYSRLVNKRTGAGVGLLLCALGASGISANYFIAVMLPLLLYPACFRRSSVSRTALVLGLFPAMLVMFLLLILFITTSQFQFMFFRYMAAAFPALITGVMWALFSCKKKCIPVTIAAVFVTASALTNLTVRNEAFYSDTTLVGYYLPLQAMRNAGTWAEEQNLPVIALGLVVNHFSSPELGYTDSSLTVITVQDCLHFLEEQNYTIVVPPVLPWGDDGEAILRNFTEQLSDDYRLEFAQEFTGGPFSASCYYLYWEPKVSD